MALFIKNTVWVRILLRTKPCFRSWPSFLWLQLRIAFWKSARGFGALTKPLAERAKQVVSLEIDRTLIPILNVTLEKYANARVICDDVMRTNLSALVAEAFGADCPSLRVAANLPYYITTDVLTKLMRELPQAKSIAVMIQKEVGDKLLSGPGDDRIRSVGRDVPISLPCDARARCAGGLLQPAAKVDSSFMVLEKLEQPSVNAGDEEIFTRLGSQRVRHAAQNAAQ